MSPDAPGPVRGDTVELVLDEIDEKGRVLGRAGGRSIAVRGGVLGARVIARVHSRKRRGIEATLETELVPSPGFAPPRCVHFGTCGGCSFQHLSYAAQLEARARMLERILAPLGLARIEPVFGCAEPWNYRNKMDFTFATRRWLEASELAAAAPERGDGLALGLHVRAHHEKVLDLRACEIAFAEAAPIVASARELARGHGLTAWDVRRHEGLLRHLVLRKGFASGEILADLVTHAEEPELIVPYVRSLLARHPEVTAFVQHVNPGVAAVASGTLARVHHGRGWIEERLAGLSFAISAETFFQTNTPQAEVLVRVVRELAGVRAGDVVFDLYCGCGALALALARGEARPSAVVGFELVAAAVQDARENAARNDLPDARFVAGDLARTLERESLESLGVPRPDVCVVDPPRAGMHARTVGALRALLPRTIVYVSCNPGAAVRDLRALIDSGYMITRTQPIDLFPHTPHLECVFGLERNLASDARGH